MLSPNRFPILYFVNLEVEKWLNPSSVIDVIDIGSSVAE